MNSISGTVPDEFIPEFLAKNGELFHTVFEIPNIIALITKIRYKMAPKNILIFALWLADRSKIGL